MIPFRRRPRAVAQIVVLLLLCGTAAAADSPVFLGRPLVDVLGELQDRGLALVFSSAVVDAELEVTVEPHAGDLRGMLEEILAPLGLAAREGPGETILVVANDRRSGKLAGRVVTASRGAPVFNATLRVARTGDETLSDAEGRFEFPAVEIGAHELVVEAIGFAPATLTRIEIGADLPTTLTIELRAQPTFVTEVVVTPSRQFIREDPSQRRTLTGEDAVLVPTAGGDISRVVEQLPGVAAADHSAAFNVRGSLAADVSLVLDGLELYDPFHLQSFQSPFSVIDTNIVDRIDFFGGGFSADLGDRHGGFVEVSTFQAGDAGNGEVEIGTLNSRVAYQAPMSEGKGAWLVSARGWYPETFHTSIQQAQDENLEPKFVDLYTKAVFNVSPRAVVSVHGLFAYDRLQFTETDEVNNEAVDALTRNAYLWVRSLNAWTDEFSSETILSGGRIARRRDGISVPDEELSRVDDDRRVNFFGLRNDSIWRISERHALKAGADVRRLDSEYDYVSVDTANPDDSSVIKLEPSGTSIAAYVAHRARAARNLTTELGLRWDRQTYTRDNQLSPRFNLVWTAGPRSELRLGMGRYHQSQRIHELHVEDGETEFSRAEVSEQIELSFQHELPHALRLRADVYYRKLSKIRPRYENLYETIEFFPETSDDRVTIAPETARLRGVELLLSGDPGRPLFWWVSYVLSSAEDLGVRYTLSSVEDEFYGGEVPRSWDQPQAGRFLLGYRWADRWTVSLSGTVHSGWPTTPVVAVEDDGEPGWIPGELNSARFETYHRLDLRARRSFSVMRGRLSLTLDAFNLLDQENPCCLNEVFFEPGPEDSLRAVPTYDSWLGRLVSFSVLWEF